jgi:hypothetical protein
MRYEVLFYDDDRLKKAENAVEWGTEEGPSEYDDMCSYLFDTENNKIVFCDRMEPEDASLGRDLSPLVRLLNDNQ